MTRSARTYCLLFGLYSLAQFFIAPYYPLYLVSRGLDLFEINAVLAVYLVTAFVFDVPTGAVADVAGRRRSFVLGCLVRTAAYVLYTRAETFAGCLVCEFIDALGTTLVSGALDAWAVDAVRAEGDKGPMDALFARASMIGRALMIAGGVACGYLAELSFLLPWFVAGGLFALTAALGAGLMHEPRRHGFAGRERPSLTRAVGAAPVLLLLCLLSLASAFAAFPMHMLWQPRLQALAGESFRLFGWIVAALNVASLVGSALLPRLLARVRREGLLAAAALWRAATVAILAGAGAPGPAITGLVLQEIGFGLSDPIAVAWTNEHVGAAERATVLSVRSTFITLGGAAGLLSIGLVARHRGIPAAFTVSALLFACAAPGFLLLGRVARRAAPGPVPVEAMAAAATKVGPPALG
jgi:MFS family permease